MNHEQKFCQNLSTCVINIIKTR